MREKKRNKKAFKPKKKALKGFLKEKKKARKQTLKKEKEQQNKLSKVFFIFCKKTNYQEEGKKQ
jgi:16S rRNA C1402 (ribose-2'-O) methylase RsmI